MRSLICQFLILSLLFVSLEGATDVVVDGVPHGNDTSHQEEFGHVLEAHQGDKSDTELDGDHCEHCCHGHTVSATTQLASIATPLNGREHQATCSSYVPNLGQAPPTPPPNA